MNQTTGNGVGEPLSPIAMLDYLFPGFSPFARFLQSSLGINLNLYIPVLLSISFLAAAWRYLSAYLNDLVESYFMSIVDVRTDDEIYNMLMGWVAQQTFAQRSRRFVANTNLNSRMYWWRWASNDDDDDDGVEIDESGCVVTKKKKKALAYTPTFGSHWFIYKRRLLIFKRQQPATQSPYYTTSEREEISISCFGRSPWVLKELLNEARAMYLKRDEAKTLIYRGALKGTKLEPQWQRCMARTSRPFSTVILNEDVKKKLIEDVTDYLNPATRRWYANRGIPYRRGYLLWGPPGTGKSSLSLALAGFFKMTIYIVSLSSMTATEENLASLFAELPRRCVVLLEDIDTAGLTHTRDPSSPSDATTSDTPPDTTPIPAGDATGKPPLPLPGRLSLSGLLNILDGVASQEGRVLIMTTNHLEKLDKALIRPGRVDMQVKFDKADAGMTAAIFRAIYAPLDEDYALPSSSSSSSPSTAIKSAALTALNKKLAPTTTTTTTPTPLTDKEKAAQEEKKTRQKQEVLARVDKLAQEFASKVPPMEFSPAEIQGFLLKHKRNPEQAVEGVQDWLVVARKEQKEREVEQARKKEEEAKKAAKKAAEKAKKKTAAAAAKKKENKKAKSSRKGRKDDDTDSEEGEDGSDGSEEEEEGSDKSESESESEGEKTKKKGKKTKKGRKEKEKKVKPVVEVRVDTPPPSGSEADKGVPVPELALDEKPVVVVVAAPAKAMTIDTKKANEEEVEKAQVSGDSGYGAVSAVESDVAPVEVVV